MGGNTPRSHMVNLLHIVPEVRKRVESMNEWVYIRTERYPYELWTVGYCESNGKRQPESDHPTSEAATERVHFLNGGGDEE